MSSNTDLAILNICVCFLKKTIQTHMCIDQMANVVLLLLIQYHTHEVYYCNVIEILTLHFNMSGATAVPLSFEEVIILNFSTILY